VKMRPTQGVSIPRSGHGAVYQVARRYFGDAFVYCDDQNEKNRHCGCRAVPCVNPARTFAKCHDLDLRASPGMPIIPSERYFIQYRNPVRSIVSYYHVHLEDHQDECERADWERFALRYVLYWNRFIDKWVLDFPEDAAAPFYCTYESLLSEPKARMREILTFLSDEPLDDEALTRILEKRPIAPRDRLAKFEYYDPVFLRELEDAASERLAELDLPSFEDEF